MLVVLPEKYEVWDLWFDRELERKIVQSFALQFFCVFFSSIEPLFISSMEDPFGNTKDLVSLFNLFNRAWPMFYFDKLSNNKSIYYLSLIHLF